MREKRRRERRKKLFWSMYADTFETQSTRIMREREREVSVLVNLFTVKTRALDWQLNTDSIKLVSSSTT